MPKPPVYAPDVLFQVMPATHDVDCYYCTSIIGPSTDDEYVTTAQRDKARLNFHPTCLDQFVWTGLHFYAGFVRDRAKPELLN